MPIVTRIDPGNVLTPCQRVGIWNRGTLLGESAHDTRVDYPLITLGRGMP